MPAHVHFMDFNDDLVGFFNDVPSEMMLEALTVPIDEDIESTGLQCFTVDLRKSTASTEHQVQT